MFFGSPYSNTPVSASSISTLLDVSLTSLSNNQILVYNSATKKWENQSVSSASGGTVTSFSFINANGITGFVSNSTTTPSLSIALGNITPISVNASGTITGSNLSGTNTGDQIITLTGDVTGSGTSSFVTSIANDSITYSKLQNASTNNILLGRGSPGEGDYQEISLGTGISITGNVLTFTEANYTQVNTYNDLPVTIGIPPVGTIYVVLNSSGVWLFNRKESGLYRRTGNGGTLSDWERLGNWSDIAKDSNFQLVNSVDNTKLGRFDLSFITTGQTRILAWPNKNGTIALLDDITGNVVGPATAINNNVVFFDGTTGKLIKDSGLTLSGVNTGDQTITLTGDVTGSGNGSFTTTISNNAVTYDKIQNITTNNILLGRATSGAGNIEEITLGTGLSFSGTTLNASASDNSILSVIAGEDLTSFKAVRLSNNQAFLYDYTDSSQFGECIGITITGALLGNSVNIKLFGKQTVAPTLINRKEYFAGVSGTLVDTAPVTGTLQKIGVAISTSDLFINLGSPVLLI